MHKYPTNLTDKQWQVIKNMLDPKERFRKYSLRSVFDGILYIVKTGVQWRMLPSDFAPWQTVYYYFSKWKNEGLLEEIFDTLRGIVRRLSGRAESPSLGIIDSRSVRTSHHIDGQRGIDGNKKIKGRKEHIVVDTRKTALQYMMFSLKVVIYAMSVSRDSLDVVHIVSRMVHRQYVEVAVGVFGQRIPVKAVVVGAGPQ